MKVFAVLALCVLAVSGEKLFTTLKDLDAAGKSRIINGSPAAPGQFPHQVAVNFVVGGSSYFCGGALISDSWVLTAAHCADGASRFTLRFGSTDVNGGVSQTTTRAIVHSGYNQFLNNDIALIQLESPVSLNENIQPIALPSADDRVQVGETVRVSGWGKTSDSSSSISQTLNYVDLTAIANSECAGVYGSQVIIDSTLCCRGLATAADSTCNGDSGGPLTRNGVHVGIVSFVHINGCASGNPSGFVRTASLRNWIQQNSGV